ncbi:hypothetical protein COB21_01010 [Candidatus Aerophobetes bacterium]|uniref:ATP-dependent helicase n=1 Tax=Aerophobetes bacterium TaxID=2030807 RepID=A0A2A4X801_UNCAE|nr:MAG: hypothetical protein COB21_01010 [Candidatus Aerophobetes bacterium]
MLEVLDKEREKAQSLLQAGAVHSAEFSRGAYLVEVADAQNVYWPYLQVIDRELQDGFCSCPVAASGQTCAHIAAAFTWISERGLFKHEIFDKSLFKQLGLICFKRQGSESQFEVSPDKKSISFFSGEKKLLFKLSVTGDKAAQWLVDKILNKREETEETSIKFSGLSKDELALWQKGTPSLQLGFELSYWADLFKELFLEEFFNSGCQFSVEKKRGVPTHITIESPRFIATLFMAKNNWCEVVNYLDTVKFPYPFHAFQDIEIEKICYSSKEKILKVHTLEAKAVKQEKKVDLGDVYFVEGKGFFPYKEEKCLEKEQLAGEDIAYFFDNYLKILETHLTKYSIENNPLAFKYQLLIGKNQELILRAFAFDSGDLESPDSVIFGSWLFLPGKGFYKMGPLQFEEITHIVKKESVASFIDSHKDWLEGQTGFALQIPTMQVNLSFRVLEDQSIEFFRDDNAFERDENMCEFDPYVYVKDKGFYLKAEPKEMKCIKAGTKVSFHEASLFMKDMKDDLEQINGFFSSRCPVEKRGLKIYIDDEGDIISTPAINYAQEYKAKDVTLFGEFSYVKGEGFFHLPSHLMLPAEYMSKKIISKENEPFFIQFEIKNLAPLTLELDPRLKAVDDLDLCITNMKMVEGSHGLIEVEMHYESVYGKTSLARVKDFLSSSLPYAPLDIGLVFFDQPRFYWLKLLGSEAIKKGVVQIRVLEWIRIRTYQNITIKPKSGVSKTAVEELITNIETLNAQDVLNLDGLKSVLRNYQSIGAQWLWGLYCYGLSGLLCDDMGLGKTHQAMALISAVSNSKMGKNVKFLVVCPTSVLYHWEDLLLKFLPGLSVGLYYGSNRDVAKISQQTQIILTSYGILRGDIKKLVTIDFDLALFDEIQTAKNISSQVHKALLLIKASSKIGLTGTPIENSLIELKALFDIVLPKYLPSTTQYREQFVNPIERYADKSKKEQLSRLVHPFILRRKKSEVLDDLPEKTEEIAYCNLSKEQEDLYNKVVTGNAGQHYNDQGDLAAMHVFATLNKLKQVCNHPCLISKDLDQYDKIPCGKWELFKQLFHEAQNSGAKVVIFTQYLNMIVIFKLFLEKEGIKFASLQGSTRNRREEIMRFKDDPECMVFIGSLKAAGTGIDLTAGSVVIHYDRWWNPAKENQATDRVHRIGQNRGVQVFKMVTKGTLEEYIDELILRKQGLLETVVGYDDFGEVKKIDKETLKLILDKIAIPVEKKSL